jgi:hypothetical protein
MGFLQKIFGSQLRPVERRLIEELANELPPEAKSLLLRQVGQVNLVQRHAKDKEVNLYSRKRGSLLFDEDSLFPAGEDAMRIARVSFSVKDRPDLCHVDFWVVGRHIFSLEFNQSPAGIPSDGIEIRKTTVLADPMRPTEPEKRKPITTEVLTGWLKEWCVKWHVRELFEPLPQSERENHLRLIDAKLPQDYLELIAQTEGMRIESWLIHGLSKMRDVVMPEENYLVLAENDELGLLAVKKESVDRLVYLFKYEEGGIVYELGRSLHSAIEQQLQEERGGISRDRGGF